MNAIEISLAMIEGGMMGDADDAAETLFERHPELAIFVGGMKDQESDVTACLTAIAIHFIEEIGRVRSKEILDRFHLAADALGDRAIDDVL